MDPVREHIQKRIQTLEESKQEAIQRANACHGGICELQEVLALLDSPAAPPGTEEGAKPPAPSSPVMQAVMAGDGADDRG